MILDLAGRCTHGYDLATQHPQLCGCTTAAAGKASGIAATEAAAPAEAKARIDAAIERYAATGADFSANSVRSAFPDISGAIVGARFNAAARRGRIYDTGRRVASTKASTHGHEVRVWRGLG